MHPPSTGVTLVVLALVLGCSKPKGDEYTPIGKYANCRYSLEYMAPFVGVLRGTVVLRRDGEETIGEHTYVREVAVISGIPGAEPETTFYRKAKDGVYAIEAKHKDKPEYLETALPLEVGTPWKYATAERRATVAYRLRKLQNYWTHATNAVYGLRVPAKEVSRTSRPSRIWHRGWVW